MPATPTRTIRIAKIRTGGLIFSLEGAIGRRRLDLKGK